MIKPTELIEFMTIDEIAENTANLFDKLDFDKLDDDNVENNVDEVRQRMESYRALGLTNQLGQQSYDLRVEKAQGLGFVEVTAQQMFRLIMHDHAKGVRKTWKQHTYEYFYNDLRSEKRENAWNRRPLIVWSGFRFLPHNTAMLGCLNYLEEAIPYEAARRIEIAKRLEIFNSFSVMAPSSAFVHSKEHRSMVPIIVGEVARMLDKGNNNFEGIKERYFFLSQWQS